MHISRSTAVGASSTCARLGGILAPQVSIQCKCINYQCQAGRNPGSSGQYTV